MALDERLHRELERAARPADPSGIYEDLLRRRGRRQVAHRVGRGLLVVAVVAGSVAGVYGLGRVFAPGSSGSAAGAGGVIMFTGRAPGSAFGLLTVDVATGELGGVPGSDVGRPEGAAWSPDGTRIAFSLGDEPGIYVMDADGSGLRQVSDVGRDPVWSRDGSRIAFTWHGDTDEAIHIVDAEGVTTTWIARGGWPSWSPDGSELVFSDRGRLMIQEADPDASPRPLGVGMGFRPDWSPDGSQIVFAGDTGGLFVVSPDGSGLTHVRSAPGFYLDPTWSPDGSMIAFAYQPPMSDCPPGGCSQRYEVWVMNADGSNARAVTALSSDERPNSGPSPDWYPVAGSNPPVVPIDASPTPTPAESPTLEREDIGLGFPVCNVSSIEADFVAGGGTESAYVATRMGDVGGCPQPEEAFNVVALDVDADGLADATYGPIGCELECRTFSAPDIDGNGTSELLVVQSGGSVVGLRLYDFDPDEDTPAIVPMTVAPPGDPEAGYDPGEEARLLLGGDEWYHYALRCGDPDTPDGPGLIVTSAESLPHDSPDAEWHAQQVTFVLRDGMLEILDVEDFTEPMTSDAPSFQSGETLCGSNLGP